MAAYNAKFLRMISSSEPTNLVPNRPNGGFCYLFEGDSIAKKNDWRLDGWIWRQQGTTLIMYEGVTCKKFFFYTVLKKEDGKQELSSAFKREVYHHPDFPLRFLISYVGDSSAQMQIGSPSVKIKPKEKDETKQLPSNSNKKSRKKITKTAKAEKSKHDKYFKMITTLEPVNVPVLKANGGFQYLYEADCPAKKEDWRADGWHWRQQGSSLIQYQGITCKKYFFYTIVEKEGKRVLSHSFKRIVYHHPDFPLRFLIIYVGDCRTQVPLPHGNAKSKEKRAIDFVTTRKSTREELKEREESASIVYQELIGSAPQDLNTRVVTAPRDLKQVRNAQQFGRRKLLFSPDSSFTLNDIVGIDKFIKNIESSPDVIVIMQDSLLANNIRTQLIDSNDELPHFCWSYEINFDLGDLCISTLSVSLIEFQENPVVPVIVMVNDSQLKSTYRYFWQKVTEFLPELVNCKSSYLVTNEEEVIVKCIEEHLPNMDIYRCWNRLLSDVKLRLKTQLSITNLEDISKYEKDIIHLLEQETALSYYRELSDITTDPDRWHPDFIRYYKKFIDSGIERIGRWVMSKHNIKSAAIGKSSALTSVLGHLQEWNRRPLGIVILSLEKLAEFINVEISRSKLAQGTWTIRPHIADTYSSTDLTEFPETVSPENIVNNIRVMREAILKEKIATNSHRNRKEQKSDLPNVEGLSIYERILYFLRTDSIKLGNMSQPLLVKSTSKKTKKNCGQINNSKRFRSNGADHDYHSGAANLCSREEESENSSTLEDGTNNNNSAEESTSETVVYYIEDEEVMETSCMDSRGEAFSIAVDNSDIENQVEICPANETPPQKDDGYSVVDTTTSATCIYFEESDVVVIFEEHEESLIEVVDQSSDPFDEKILQHETKIPNSPTATSFLPPTHSATQTLN